MGTRGRKSTADVVAALTDGSDYSGDAYVAPPDSLTSSQKKLWYAVVATKPPEWFRDDSLPILEAYCKTVDHYRQLSRRLDDTYKSRKTLDDTAKLVTAVAKLANLMGTLASKLRLTQQARYTPATAARRDRQAAATAQKPWLD